MEWFEAADLIVKGMAGAIAAKTVTYDFERLIDGAKLLKSSERIARTSSILLPKRFIKRLITGGNQPIFSPLIKTSVRDLTDLKNNNFR
ncbi:hypothetical protein J2125_004192 [Erwinia toletana]|uniref:Uncharacterized protein n=1 Tax=Winslowiella toletana TaxID=92490 RepID=A0ABS4PEE8_9GAMM|nr:hypothetical protein [Winslowiella toletana]